MARKRTRRTMLTLGIIIAVGLLIVAVVVVAEKLRDTSIDDPWALAITVDEGDGPREILPYRVCDVLAGGDSCETREDAGGHVRLGDNDVATVDVGAEVAAGAWAVQRFYQDEASNSADQHQAGEDPSFTLAGSAAVAGERSALGVAEISATVVGRDAAGEETVYGITWSIANDAAAGAA